MTNAKPTPGPWSVYQEAPGSPCRIIGPTEFGMSSIASTREAADARLIAAAPDLLAVARDVLAEYQDTLDLDANDRSTSGRISTLTAERLRAAVAKAEER